jgi:hypothetical protein
VHISEALLVAALIGLDPKEYDYRKNISAMWIFRGMKISNPISLLTSPRLDLGSCLLL